MSWKKIIWACDPIGSFLFIVSATLLLLALDWAGGVYPWKNVHVVAPLVIGFACLVAFGLYGESIQKYRYALKTWLTVDLEWKGRDDGLVAHVFFQGGPNFGLSVFAFAVEG